LLEDIAHCLGRPLDRRALHQLAGPLAASGTGEAMGNPLDRSHEDVVAHTIVAALMGDDMFIHNPVDSASKRRGRQPSRNFRMSWFSSGLSR
jgi:hypothetical protein